MRPIIKVVAAVMLSTLITSACAESTTIRIRFLNGRTGKPLAVKYMKIGGGGYDLSDYRVERVEQSALVVNFKDKSTFTFRDEGYYRCDTNRQTDPTPRYSLKEITEHGLVGANVCGGSTVAPTKGELVIFSRHAHFWEAIANLRGLFICA